MAHPRDEIRRIAKLLTRAFVWSLTGVSFAPLAAAPSDSVVVFNEVMYHPASVEDGEWLELYNQMAVDIDLSGWRLTGGIDYTFPDATVIRGGGYFLVRSGQFEGLLDNGGETIELRDNSDRLMDSIRYEDDLPWPVGADGSGASLAKESPLKPTADLANWRASAEVGGTPGVANFPEPGRHQSDTLLDWSAEWLYNDSGDDLGRNWAARNHGAGERWRSGPGPLGWDTTEPEIPFATRVTRPHDNVGVITYYFETEFTATAEQVSGVRQLQLVHLIDDGAVFYLNGVELARYEMPAGPVSAATLSTGRRDANVSEPLPLPADALVAGTNRFSVEVHQRSPGDSDIAFGMKLDVEFVPAERAPDPIVFNEIASAEDADFRVELANTGDVAQPLSGYAIATSAGDRFEFNSGQADAGGYVVLNGGDLGFRPESGDRLFLFQPGGKRLVDARRVTDRLRGLAEAQDGAWLFPSSPTFGEANAFSFSKEVVINEIMYRARPSFPEEGIPPTYEDVRIMSGNARWRYEQSGVFPGNGWMLPEFDDSAWPSGEGALGKETAALPEPIRTALLIGPLTYYFRTQLQYDGDPAADRLRIRALVDDGFVLYVNGVEALRWGMPAGKIRPETLAESSVTNARFQEISLPENLLVQGSNVLAAEVHKATPGSGDVVFALEVFSETQTNPGVPARPFTESGEEWLELFNRSGTAIDLSGWKIHGGIRYGFPEGTTLAGGAYLVVARDLGAFATAHPGISALGDYSGRLGNRSDRIALVDAIGNPADEVHYFDGGRWDDNADGHGPSLELRDPFADNARGEAWLASDEAAKSEWRTYRYRVTATTPVRGAPTLWREFAFGLLHGEGELLIDDISVLEDPDGLAIERIQNGSFTGNSAAHWRFLGNHQRSSVENEVLHVIASGPTEYQGNQIETTLADRATIKNRAEYEISYRARWLSGSSHLNARLYFNRGPRTTELTVPSRNGTPGRQNSRYVANAGPTFGGLSHSPSLPSAGQPVTVRVTPSDLDGIRHVMLHFRRDGSAWRSSTMSPNGSGDYTGRIPGQPAGAIVQFYVAATDLRGATNFFPAKGEHSRALFEVDDGVSADGTVHDLRVIMLKADSDHLHRGTNTLSNELLGGTVLYQNESFYDVGIRLKGSFVGRNVPRVGFNLKFPPDRLFRGVHDKVAVDRSAHGNIGVDEIIIKHVATRAGGGIPGMYDDIVQFIAPRRRHNARAELRMAGFDDIYLDSQFDNGSEGTVYEFEVYRWATATVDPDPESLKQVGPNAWANVPFGNFGDNKEDYRWHCLITTNRTRDHYTDVIRFLKIFDLRGSELEAAAPQVMDLDSVLRTLAFQILVGPGDSTYIGGADHNFRLYARPDGKVMYLPWDWDSAFSRSTSASLVGGGKFARLVNRPAHLRTYHGHLKDIVEEAFNPDYMAAWTSHYGELGGQNFASRLNYIRRRSEFVLDRLPEEIPFAITSNSGKDFSVSESAATITGNGWIDVHSVHSSASGALLDLEWTDSDSWRATVPLEVGANDITLRAFDRKGVEVGMDSVTITNDSLVAAATRRNLAISEIMYHPAVGENEFIEVMNISSSTISLSGVHFTRGVEHAFPAGAELGPGERLAVSAFANDTRLSNSGERITLIGEGGTVIRDFAYSDSLPWPTVPDGSGPSLVLIRPRSNPDHAIAFHWRASTGHGGNPGATDATRFEGEAGADADFNGIDDFIDYGLGHSAGSTDGLPTLSGSANGSMRISYAESVLADDIRLLPEWSSDMHTWNALSDGELFHITRAPLAGGRRRILIDVELPREAFFRLRALSVP